MSVNNEEFLLNNNTVETIDGTLRKKEEIENQADRVDHLHEHVHGMDEKHCTERNDGHGQVTRNESFEQIESIVDQIANDAESKQGTSHEALVENIIQDTSSKEHEWYSEESDMPEDSDDSEQMYKPFSESLDSIKKDSINETEDNWIEMEEEDCLSRSESSAIPDKLNHEALSRTNATPVSNIEYENTSPDYTPNAVAEAPHFDSNYIAELNDGFFTESPHTSNITSPPSTSPISNITLDPFQKVSEIDSISNISSVSSVKRPTSRLTQHEIGTKQDSKQSRTSSRGRKRKNNPTDKESSMPKYMKYFKISCQYYLNVFPIQEFTPSSTPTQSTTNKSHLISASSSKDLKQFENVLSQEQRTYFLEESLRNAKIAMVLLLEQRYHFQKYSEESENLHTDEISSQYSFSKDSSSLKSFKPIQKNQYKKYQQTYIKSVISIQMHIIAVLRKLQRLEEADLWSIQRDALFELNQELLQHEFDTESNIDEFDSVLRHSSHLDLLNDMVVKNNTPGSQFQELSQKQPSKSQLLHSNLHELIKENDEDEETNRLSRRSGISNPVESWKSNPTSLSVRNDDLSSSKSNFLNSPRKQFSLPSLEGGNQFLLLDQIYPLIYMSADERKPKFEYSPKSDKLHDSEFTLKILQSLKKEKKQHAKFSHIQQPKLSSKETPRLQKKGNRTSNSPLDNYNILNRKVTLPTLNISKAHKGRIDDGTLVAPSNMFPIFGNHGDILKGNLTTLYNQKKSKTARHHTKSPGFQGATSRLAPSTGRANKKSSLQKKGDMKRTELPQIAWGVNYDPATVYSGKDNLTDPFGTLHGMERFGKKLVLRKKLANEIQPKPPQNSKKNIAPRKKPNLAPILPNNIHKSVHVGPLRIVSPSKMFEIGIQTEKVVKHKKTQKANEIRMLAKISSFDFPLKKSKRFRLYKIKKGKCKNSKRPELLLAESEKKLRKYFKHYNTNELNNYLTSEEQDAKPTVLTAILIIQLFWRKRIAQKRLRESKKSVVLVQAGCRSLIQQLRFKRMDRSALTIQTNFRGFVHRISLIRFKAARRLQMAFRCMMARKALFHLQVRLRSAIKIQLAYRCYIARKVLKEKLTQHQKAITIQCAFRCMIAKMQVNRMRLENKSSLVIQGAWRKYKSKQDQYKAAKKIQRLFRRYLFVKRIVESRPERSEKIEQLRKEIFERRWKAALIIQRVYRGHRGRLQLSKMDKSALIITRTLRRFISLQFMSRYSTSKTTTKSDISSRNW